MLRMEDALDRILGSVTALDTAEAALSEVFGMFLAEDTYADIDIPPFDNSAVDGYAVRSSDTAHAAPQRPVALRDVGEILAGNTSVNAVGAGEAARIMTGAVVPEGADSIVMIEDTRTHDGPDSRRVEILAAAEANQHVRRKGSDIQSGTRVLSAGTRIRPAEIAMLATMGR